MTRTANAKPGDRVFVREGRRHYRRTYSSTEMRIGLVVLGLLVGMLCWVAWRGAHPDPSLFAAAELGGEMAVSSSGSQGAGSTAERGAFPEQVAAPGWTESGLASFDSNDLYVKINGREGYYKSFGFEQLVFVSLVNDSNPDITVDIEMFDQGTGANALGAYAGERPPDVVPAADDSGMFHFDRNAFFVVRDRFYIRAIGSEESEVVQAQLDHLKARLEESLTGAALPWGYSIFVGKLGHDPGRVSFLPENAFSFGFARDVYASLLDDEETELFVTLGDDVASAAVLANQFEEGFLGYGALHSTLADVSWIEDRYIQTIAGVASTGSWVFGVRGAPSVEVATESMAELREILQGLPVPEFTAPEAEAPPEAELAPESEGAAETDDDGYSESY